MVDSYCMLCRYSVVEFVIWWVVEGGGGRGAHVPCRTGLSTSLSMCGCVLCAYIARHHVCFSLLLTRAGKSTCVCICFLPHSPSPISTPSSSRPADRPLELSRPPSYPLEDVSKPQEAHLGSRSIGWFSARRAGSCLADM